MPAYNKISLAALVTLLPPRLVAGLAPYQHFFPARREALVGLINGKCRDAYSAFLQGKPASETDPLLGYWKENDPGWAVDNCLLEAATEGVKVDFSSAQVILGLMPALLGSLGPSSQELSLLLVLGNRQFLAFSLALGSPFTNGVHSFDFAREIKSLPRLNDNENPPDDGGWRAGILFLYLQYFAVFAAITNIAELSYELAQSAGSTIIQDSSNYLPGTMAIVGFAMHLLVASAFYFCANIHHVNINDNSIGPPIRRSAWNLRRFRRWISQQLCAIEKDNSRCVKLNTTDPSHTILSWLAKVAIFTHVGWHIVAFSTVLFVSSQDAVTILFRYFASVCICRMVTANEIALLGMILKWAPKDQNSQSSVCTSKGGKDTT